MGGCRGEEEEVDGGRAAGQRWYSAAHKSNANRILVLIK